ncbi:MAG: hypothetical protein Q4C24_02350 [Candidatus Saccharibacteria bacterium]|nr:hypothetical protein [Candidatus Saccharibacteria bacterium]
MIFLDLRDFWAAVRDLLMKISAAPVGMPMALASILRFLMRVLLFVIYIMQES